MGDLNWTKTIIIGDINGFKISIKDRDYQNE